MYNSQIPIISAVGHETDFTISDFVADLRAPTPSAAAELATPDITELRMSLLSAEGSLKTKVFNKIKAYKLTINSLSTQIYSKNPHNTITQNRQKLNFLVKLLTHKYSATLEAKQKSLEKSAAALSRLNPVAVLSRGYTVTTTDQGSLVSIDNVQPGNRIKTKLAGGAILSIVSEIEKGDVPDEKATDL